MEWGTTVHHCSFKNEGKTTTMEDSTLKPTTMAETPAELVRKPVSDGKKRRRAIRKLRNAPKILPAKEEVPAQSDEVSESMAQPVVAAHLTLPAVQEVQEVKEVQEV